MADVNTNIEAALEAAAEAETDESSKSEEAEETVVEATKESKSETKTEHKGKGAQGRIQELIGDSKALESQIEQLNQTLSARDEEIGKLVDLLELRDNDAKVVAKINELHQTNPEFKDIIESLDAAIRGEEVNLPKSEKEGESNAKTEAEAVAKAQALIREAQVSMDEQLASQQADLILHKADVLTERYMAELPETYNEEDQEILRTVLVDHINWDAIEENPDSLNDEFASGFQSALNWYKTPKGATTAAQEDETKNTQKSGPVTAEHLAAFVNQDWGKLNTVETPDGVKIKPEVSDADFTQALASAMKKNNALNSN